MTAARSPAKARPRPPARPSKGIPPRLAERLRDESPDGKSEQVGRAADPRLRRLAILSILSVVIILVAFVYCQIQISQAAVARAAATARAEAESTRIEALRSRVAQLQSPGRIVAEAQRLGFVTPETVAFLPVQAVSPRDTQ